ncbi:MAG: DUF1566 domain-containing protein, partial [Gammaproteobacteria bacterium]|nr:DUF1566 domain-containing protein [Gammaproteobacteria bacterium]
MHTYSACLLKSVTCFLFLAYFTLNSAHAAGPFTINGDGTVTDQFSGVMWQQEDDGIPRTWDDAISYCQNLSLAGHADWRLPNAYELAAPLDYSLYNPAVDSGSYPNTKELYWSGDTYYGVNSTLGLVVNFKNGNIGGLDKNENNLVYVRCVRGNSYSPLTSLSIGSADTVTVTDTDTKLIWQRAQSGGTLNWNDADAYCANLNLAGLGDWRLPSIKELQSLIDYSQINPAADATLFPDTNDDGYWSGSEYANTPGLIWNAHLGDGYTGWGGDLNNSYYYTRCIHDDSGITLNVTVNGAGQNTGTITSEPAGINCGTDCIEGYTNSSTVTLAATADSGASFSGWSGDCSGTDPATTITIDAAKSCTAAFTAAEETVTDIDTGLTWQRQDDAVQRTWSDANTYCQNLNSGGYDDWRSPSIYELADLPDYSRYNPVVDNSSYLNVKQRYWSGDGNAAYPVNAWFVDFKNGNIGHLDKSELNYIRCARGVSYSPLASLSVSSTDTVTDGVKNLTWQRTQSNAELNWSEANDYCANLVLAGLSEWRLPSIKELQQLIDYSQVNPAANATLFPNTNNAAYWSNSGSLNTPGFIWIAHLGGGYTGWGGDTNNSYYYARCVHNGINLSVTLTVNGAADQGTGTITSAPAGINCGADCTEDYANGATVTLAAAPGSGASFSGWSGDCSGADPAITVTMDAAKNCTAAFISDTVVTDAFTGLMWQQENDSISRSLSNATTYCQNLALAGYSDWRLPSIYELAGLPDYSRYNPAVDSSSFLNVKEWYWSGDGNAAYPNNAWFVDFKHGHINHLTKSELNYIRCVRGASYSPLASLSVSGTDTVADSVKNLTWQRTQSNAGLNWSDADAYCTDLVLAGLSEWRLPSIKELQQLIDYSQVNPAANATLFPNTNALYYWSNSEHANMPGIRWAAHLGDGNTGYVQPGELYYARCVHNTIGNELLTVNSAGQGSGTITSNPAGINCGADCTENYANGATVTLSAAPESGASFSGWSGDCSSTDPAITVTMDAAKSCTAEFTIPCSYASDITESAHTAEAGNSSFNLTAPAGCAWTGIVDSNAAAWLSLTVSTGTDSGEITYYFTENTDTSARTGTIQVNGANITVTQEEAKYIPPTAGFTAEPAQGRAPLDVTVDASASNDSDGTIIGYEWALFLGEEQIQSNAGQQASFSLTEGGTYKIVLTVTDNDGLANTAESELPVKPPCNYTTNITERTHAAEAGSGSFDLTAPAGCEWTGTVDSNAVAWLSLSPLNGAGDGTITYSFTENTDISARTGTIQVNGANIITVTQEGIPPTADFAVTPGNTPLEIKLDASASTGRIIRYDWIITDGANTHELFGMTVTFSAPGEALYQITLTVTDSNDLQDSISKSVPIGELISFEGFKAQYCPGDSMQADVIENASLARSENTDLWVWFEYQDSVLYVLPPVEPFPQRSNLSGDPSSFKTDIPPADKIHSVWEFEAPPLGMPFSTTFHAQYVLAGKNPLTGGADDVLSNKASQTITLFPANSPECQGYGDDDFTPIDSAVPNTVYRSNSIPLDWLSGQTQASISGGQQTVLIINGQNTFSADSLVNNGDTLAIQTLSPPISNSVVIALTIGQQTLKWSIASAPLDSVPVMEGAMAGSTAGEFTVNEAGASVYQIPITVSPGTAGIQPVLSLAYSSQGNDGPVGIGWSLTGLSVISRCPATLAQDGFIDGIDFDDNDRFCLDGERLIAVNGEYGADQTEYRTEQNNFSRIISHGSAGNGPAYFIVETKAGLIMGYGLNDDSRIEAHGREE